MVDAVRPRISLVALARWVKRHQLDVSDAASARRLSPRDADVFRAWAFRALADIELDGLAFAQIVEADALHAALMEEILLPLRVRNEPEAFVCDFLDRASHRRLQ